MYRKPGPHKHSDNPTIYVDHDPKPNFGPKTKPRRRKSKLPDWQHFSKGGWSHAPDRSAVQHHGTDIPGRAPKRHSKGLPQMQVKPEDNRRRQIAKLKSKLRGGGSYTRPGTPY